MCSQIAVLKETLPKKDYIVKVLYIFKFSLNFYIKKNLKILFSKKFDKKCYIHVIFF